MRILALTAALAGSLLVPATAAATETAFVASGVLTYTAGAGTVDVVSVGDGVGPYFGKVFLSESQTPSGFPGAGCTAVPGEPTVVCTGVTAVDLRTLDGNDFAHVMNALPATIDAGPGVDTIWGGFGADTLTGGDGADDIRGGFGDDRIYADDGVKDTIDCGPGDDRAVTDALDVVSNCEVDPPVIEPVVEPVVEKKPAAEAKKDEPKPETSDAKPRAVESPLPPVSPVQIVAGALKVAADGSAPLTLGCAATEVDGCAGTVFLDPAPAEKAKKGKKGKAKARAARRGRFGKSPFQIAAGKKKNLKVKLSPEARRLLGLPTGKRARAARRGRRVKAVVTVVQRGKHAQRSVVELRG